MTTEQKVDGLVFDNIAQYPVRGNELQVSQTKYRGVLITERTWVPWDIFRDISVVYVVELVLPLDKFGGMINLAEEYYTDDGFGLPQVETIQQAIEFIDLYKDKYEKKDIEKRFA